MSIAAQEQGTGDARKAVPRTPEELEKLRSVVASAVGIDTTRGDTIALEELPFNNDFATEVTHELDQQQKQDFWWDLGAQCDLSCIRRGGLCDFVAPAQTHAGSGYSPRRSGWPVDGNPKRQWERYMAMAPKFGEEYDSPPGVVTVEVLNRLIKENPANMTQAIRDWMNKGRTTEQN